MPVTTPGGCAYSSAMNDTVAPFFASPELHLLTFDVDQALVTRMNAEAYFRSSFLDGGRVVTLDPQPQTIPLGPLLEAASEVKPEPVGWIFQIAHCGSTLLSRLIDQPEHSLVLREPPPLRQVAVMHARGSAPADWSARLRLAHAAAARRFEADLPTVVKANAPVNFMLPELSALEPSATAILLHLPLADYVVAVLATPEHRQWVDRVTTMLEPAIRRATGVDALGSTAERAAALWLAQMIAFQDQLAANPNAFSLDANHLFGDPAPVANAAAAHFGIAPLDPDGVAAAASLNAKQPGQPYDDEARRERAKANAALLKDEIETARRWIDAAPASDRLSPRLGRPLIGEAPPLLT